MKSKFGIIGCIIIVLSAIFGFFFDFAGADIVQIAIAAAGFASVIIGIVKDKKEKGQFTWKTVVVMVLASIGGILCVIGGCSQEIFKELIGGVLALLAIIFGKVIKE